MREAIASTWATRKMQKKSSHIFELSPCTSSALHVTLARASPKRKNSSKYGPYLPASFHARCGHAHLWDFENAQARLGPGRFFFELLLAVAFQWLGVARSGFSEHGVARRFFFAIVACRTRLSFSKETVFGILGENVEPLFGKSGVPPTVRQRPDTRRAFHLFTSFSIQALGVSSFFRPAKFPCQSRQDVPVIFQVLALCFVALVHLPGLLCNRVNFAFCWLSATVLPAAAPPAPFPEEPA